MVANSINKFTLIFLTGMPGCGKTFWGRKWAAHHGWQFKDLDDAIEAIAQQTIPDIFAEKGETHFRQLESETLLKVIKDATQNTIIATGGGVVLREENMKTMASHCTVWLQVSIPTLLLRLQSDTNIRPLLSGPNPKAKLRQIYEAREAFYATANIHLDAGNLSTKTFQTILKKCSKPHSLPASFAPPLP